MVRVIEIMFATAFADESLMQAHELEALGGGSSGTGAMMQNAKQMENQYKDILQNVVQSGSWDDPVTGKPWVPSKRDVLDPVDKILEDMKGVLVDQKDANNGIMGAHERDIKACNSVLSSAIADTIVGLRGTMQTDRGNHKTCRKQEDTDIVNMESTCKSFDTMQAATCNQEQNWFAAITTGAEGQGSLRETVTQAVACRTNIQKTTAQANTCDGLQATFTESYCSYKTELDSACSTQSSCWDTAKQNRDLAAQTIDTLETEQKVVYRMIGRIKCYLALLFRKADGGSTPVQADITACEGAKVTDAPLDIDYGSVEPKLDCYNLPGVVEEQVSNAPGDGKWFSAEFGSMTQHGKLTPDSSAC